VAARHLSGKHIHRRQISDVSHWSGSLFQKKLPERPYEKPTAWNL